jgi:hypothetical protein
VLLAGNWEQMICACQLKTYEAGQNATNPTSAGDMKIEESSFFSPT